MLQILKNFFINKNTDNSSFNPEEFQAGQLVELEYVDPKKTGIISDNTLTFTRLNRDELENRIVRGTIERITKNTQLKCYMIALKCFKQMENETVVREYLFLDYEIVKCRELK
jgi:hypothetical protein